MFFEVQFSSIWQYMHRKTTQIAALLFVLCVLLPLQPVQAQDLQEAEETADAARPQINLRYFSEGANPWQGTIFWFGKVERGTNYGDVRIAYDDKAVVFYLHVFDRQLLYDTRADADRFAQWDGATLYLDTQTDLASPLAQNSVRFDAQINHWESRSAYQRSFRWQDGTWKTTAAAFDTDAGYRGDFSVDREDNGWSLRFRVPFASLGVTGAPAQGTVWRMALAMHDRDEMQGPVLPDQVWPSDMQPGQPQTWGHIRFGFPEYQAPIVSVPQTLVIRNGVNGISAPDAAVGGHSICGEPYRSDFFGKWGNANYAGYTQFNIQNQSDIADFPCFSKYYVTYPLSSLPAEASIVKAKLTLYMFGNAGYNVGDAKPSYIQVARVAQDWSEQSITWNNAPPVLENYGGALVAPHTNDISDSSHEWDLTRAVADAHAARQPLRLVLYSLDGDYHSGKYFWSADMNVAEGRPPLEITWGDKDYALSVLPVKQMIPTGGTATYEIRVGSLRAGETVSLRAGSSTPPGLDVTISPQQVSAPGGQARVTLTDRGDSQAARVYRVPITVVKDGETSTLELIVFVNGKQLFLPSIKH